MLVERDSTSVPCVIPPTLSHRLWPLRDPRARAHACTKWLSDPPHTLASLQAVCGRIRGKGETDIDNKQTLLSTPPIQSSSIFLSLHFSLLGFLHQVFLFHRTTDCIAFSPLPSSDAFDAVKTSSTYNDFPGPTIRIEIHIELQTTQRPL